MEGKDIREELWQCLRLWLFQYGFPGGSGYPLAEAKGYGFTAAVYHALSHWKFWLWNEAASSDPSFVACYKNRVTGDGQAAEPKTPRITDAGLEHLAGLTRLEYLNLQGQHVTDAGLKHLRGMSNLDSLSLSFSGVTDAGLKHLEGLQKLRRLNLYDTKVTRQGRAALKAKLPLLEWK